MQKFRNELAESPVPANLLTVMKKLIPPEGTRRNLEGSELLDYVENNPYLLEEEEDGNASDDTSDESRSDNENSDVETQAEK